MSRPTHTSDERSRRAASDEPELPHEHEEDELAKSEQIRRAHEDRDRTRRKLTKKRERATLATVEAPLPEDLVKGRVIRTEGAYFVVRLENGEEIRAKSYKGTRAGNSNATLVAVGDVVRVSLRENEVSSIEETLARTTKLSRKAAGRRDAFEQVVVANVDTLVIVASVNEPPLRTGIIDRYIVAALDGGLNVVIAINKIDLATEDEEDMVTYYSEVYGELGYPVFGVSTVTGEGIDELKEQLIGKTSVFAGHSGVGKSSILNAIFGRAVGRTGELSKKYRRGSHTTTSSVLMPMEGALDTYVVDTPGVREFSNFELDGQNLKFFFVEFLPFQEHCRIPNCSHIHEPGCAVRQAVEDDKIAIERYMSYTKLFDEAKEEERRRIEGR